MILLDKTIGTNQIIVTVSREKVNPDNPFVLRIKSGNKDKYTINFTRSESDFPDRYDLFYIYVEQFRDWYEATYNYSFDEVDEETGEAINNLEVGLLKVVDGDGLPYRSLEEFDQSTDQFKVYQGI